MTFFVRLSSTAVISACLIFFFLIFLWYIRTYSETLELFSATESNRIKDGFAGSELFKYWFDRTELCFIAFEWFYMMYLMHLNDLYEFGSIEPNSKKHTNIEKYFDSVRFDIPGKF